MPINHDEESLWFFFKKEFEASLIRIHSLENENQELKEEVARLKAQVTSLKAHDAERKSMLWKKLQYSLDSRSTEKSQQKPSFLVDVPEKCQKEDLTETITKERTTRVPTPPPPLPSPSPVKGLDTNKVELAPPPPPPPPPSKALVRPKAVRRVPEVMDFYRSLMRRDPRSDNKNNGMGFLQVAHSKNMIGEIENRSTYLSAIKSDVETQGGHINNLTREIENATFTKMSDVEAFVKWLDEQLSCLVDERAVLKHFPQWPERKADALREAAFSYRDLKKLQSEVSSFKTNPKHSLTQSLNRIQALQDRLEQSVDKVERVRDGASKRYRDFHIPWEWMLDNGVIGQMKLSSIMLAKEYMKRIAEELQCAELSQEDSLLIQGARFAFRVHQFAGGFDADTVNAFEELKKMGINHHKLSSS